MFVWLCICKEINAHSFKSCFSEVITYLCKAEDFTLLGAQT